MAKRKVETEDFGDLGRRFIEQDTGPLTDKQWEAANKRARKTDEEAHENLNPGREN